MSLRNVNSSRRGRVLEQVGDNDDVASCPSGELFVLFLPSVGLVIDDKVNDASSQVGLDGKYLLALRQYQVGSVGRGAGLPLVSSWGC
jgi:hypothetical protein